MRRALVIRAMIGVLLVSAGASPAFAGRKGPTPELERFYLRLANGPRELARMAGCLVNQDADGARELFDYELNSREYFQAASEFSENGGNCLFLSWELRSSSLMFLGAVAERLIDEDRPARPATAAGASPRQGGGAHLWIWQDLADEDARRVLPLAYCLLAGHPDRVEAVLEARQTSNGERKVFNAMKDEIDGCIPAGETWTLQPQILRAALAVAYYRSVREAVATANVGAAG